MAIQLRRGAYADFDPQKMKPAEVAVVQEDDPTSHDGKAVYVAISPGDVKRMAALDELQDEVYNQIDTAISTATQVAVATATQAAAESASEAAQSASAAAESARTLTIDSTLTQSGQAADAKGTGDAINDVKTGLNSILKFVTVGTGYGINVFGESFSILKIAGSVFENALIRKCGKNLFNADEFDTKTEYIANTEKYYQPYLPIFVKPNTTYKVTFNMVDREAYDATTWNNRQWVSADPSALSGIDSSLFASIDTKTVNITSGPSGCLYFVNVWDNQARLDAFFQCFEVMIVESGIYDDYTTFEAYDGEDIAFSDFV